MKKIVGIIILTILLMQVIPVVKSFEDSNVEIDLYAGTKHWNIGTGIGFWISNNGDKPVTVTISCKMFNYQNSESISLDILVEPNQNEKGNFGLSNGIKRISVSAQIEEENILTRRGFSIGQLVILTG